MDNEAMQEHDPRKRTRLASYAASSAVPLGLSLLEDWRERVNTLLSSCYAPKMIVFDLDNTLWPGHLQDVVLPPFIPLLPLPICIGAQPTTVLCRSTSKPLLLPLYREARLVLDHLIAYGATTTTAPLLSIASRGSSSVNSRGILTALSVWPHLTAPQIYNKRKTNHFRCLTSITAIPYQDMLFFDDCERNVSLIEGLGVTTQLVSELGLTIDILIEALEKHIRKKQENDNR